MAVNLHSIPHANCLVSFSAGFYFVMFSIPVLGGLFAIAFVLLRRVNRHHCHLAGFQRCLEWLQVWRSNKYPEWTERRFRNLLTRATISLLSYGYTVLSWYSLTIFDCIQLRGHSYVREDVAIECYSNEWGEYAPTSIMGILVYTVGTPLGFIWLLRRQQFGDVPNSLEVLGYQFMMYRKEYRWVPVADLIWRLALIVIVRLGRPEVLQVAFLMVLLLGRAVFHAWKRPIAESMIVISQEVILGLCTFLICVVGVLFYAQKSEISAGTERTLFVIVVALLVAMFVCSCWITVKVFRSSRQARSGERSFSSSSFRSSMGHEPVNVHGWGGKESGLELLGEMEVEPGTSHFAVRRPTETPRDGVGYDFDIMSTSNPTSFLAQPLLSLEGSARA